MMLRAAQHDIRVRGYRRVSSTLSTVLRNIARLVPLEVAAEKSHQRVMQTFPPYSLIFQACLPVLLEEAANKVKPVEPERSWVDPFFEFGMASDAIVDHYREVAQKVAFEGVLLEKWTVDSLLRAARVHINLLDNPPQERSVSSAPLTSAFVDLSVRQGSSSAKRLTFPYYHANDACAELTCIGMGLLQRRRFELAVACGGAIRAIARKSVEATNPASNYGAYGFADCAVKLEILARAAEAFDQPQLASTFSRARQPSRKHPRSQLAGICGSCWHADPSNGGRAGRTRQAHAT